MLSDLPTDTSMTTMGGECPPADGTLSFPSPHAGGKESISVSGLGTARERRGGVAICILSLLSSYVQVHTGAGDSAHRRLSTSASRRRGVPATPNGRMSWLNKSVSRPRDPRGLPHLRPSGHSSSPEVRAMAEVIKHKLKAIDKVLQSSSPLCGKFC